MLFFPFFCVFLLFPNIEANYLYYLTITLAKTVSEEASSSMTNLDTDFMAKNIFLELEYFVELRPGFKLEIDQEMIAKFVTTHL